MKKKRPGHQESDMQAACVSWFRMQYPNYASLLYAIPNGGKRGVITAVIMKREGVVSGMPDLCLAVPKHQYHGAYIEMKVSPNKPSDRQAEQMRALSQQGYYCKVVYSKEEFIKVVNEYLVGRK